MSTRAPPGSLKAPAAPGPTDAIGLERASPPEPDGPAGHDALQARKARAVAIKNIAARAHSVLANATNDADLVPSPCISLCRVDAQTHWCDGCFRTLDEISKWSRLDAPGKRRVWLAIGQRAGQVGAVLAAEPP